VYHMFLIQLQSVKNIILQSTAIAENPRLSWAMVVTGFYHKNIADSAINFN